MPELKRGKFSTKELEFIDENRNVMSPQQLAEKLGRTVEIITKHIEQIADNKNITLRRKDEQAAAQDLRAKPFWTELKQQYSERELERYVYHWVGFLQQFNYDVTHSEESQICHAIDLMILMDRIKIGMKRIGEEIAMIEKTLLAEMNKDETVQDKNFIQSTMAQLQGYRAGQVTRSKELTDLLDKHSRLARDLKTTRDQRFKEIQDRKVTFGGWLKQLAEKKQRDIMSKDAELIALGSDKAIRDLGGYHEYLDGKLDRPILSAETITEQDTNN